MYVELLEGFYDDWVLRERERLRLLYLRCLRQLMHVYRQQGAFEESLACAQQILACDPCARSAPGGHAALLRPGPARVGRAPVPALPGDPGG